MAKRIIQIDIREAFTILHQHVDVEMESPCVFGGEEGEVNMSLMLVIVKTYLERQELHDTYSTVGVDMIYYNDLWRKLVTNEPYMIPFDIFINIIIALDTVLSPIMRRKAHYNYIHILNINQHILTLMVDYK